MVKIEKTILKVTTDNKRITEFFIFGKRTLFKKCCGKKMIRVGVTKEYDFTDKNYKKGRKNYQSFWDYRLCSECGNVEDCGSLRSMYHIISIPKIFKKFKLEKKYSQSHGFAHKEKQK